MFNPCMINAARAGLGAAAALGVSAAACPPDESRQVLLGALGAEAHQDQATSLYLTGVGDSQRSIQLNVHDGKVSVKIDGEEVPADRILNRNGRIVVLDENGDELPLFVMPAGAGALALALRGGGGEIKWPTGVEPPRVMLGVGLATPPKALEKHLSLEPGTSTMIRVVYQGLAADRAGLGPYDVITSVDGRTPADPGSVTGVLASKEAGDTVKLEVIQEGRPRSLTVTLDVYDAKRLEAATRIGEEEGFEFGAPGHGAWLFPPLREGEGWLVDPGRQFLQWRFDAERFKDLEERIQQSIRDRLKEYAETHPAEAGVRPRQPGSVEEKLDRLEERMRQLQERLDRLIEEKRG